MSYIFSVSECNNYSGADVSALIREAALIAARDLLESDNHKMEDEMEDATVQEDIFLNMTHFTKALSRVHSSVSEKDRIYYDKMKEKLNK